MQTRIIDWQAIAIQLQSFYTLFSSFFTVSQSILILEFGKITKLLNFSYFLRKKTPLMVWCKHTSLESQTLMSSNLQLMDTIVEPVCIPRRTNNNICCTFFSSICDDVDVHVDNEDCSRNSISMKGEGNNNNGGGDGENDDNDSFILLLMLTILSPIHFIYFHNHFWYGTFKYGIFFLCYIFYLIFFLQSNLWSISFG